MTLKKTVLSSLKVVLPIGLGIYLVYYVYTSLNENEKSDLFDSFARANYLWVFLSLFVGILSHVVRAYRWKYLLDPLGHKPAFINSFYAVMIGYITNLALPRVGEVTRCGVMSKYENIPFNHLFGTVVAERLFDMLILISVIATVVLLQLDVLGDLIVGFLPVKSEGTPILIYLLLIGTVLGLGGMVFIWKSSRGIAIKIKTMLLGFLEGLRSVISMKNKGLFLFFTALIWVFYILMFYLVLFGLPETADISVIALLAAFIMGGLSIVFVQGGIGVYPLAIMQTLMLYGVSKTSGLAMGWIIWTTQTIMIIALGSFSLIMMPIYNKRRNTNGQV